MIGGLMAFLIVTVFIVAVGALLAILIRGLGRF